MYELPESLEELSAFYLSTGMTVFEYIDFHDINEEIKHTWIANSKDWAVEQVTLKVLNIEHVPVLVIRFKARAIIHNKVILASFRTNWAREIIFEAFGLTGTQEEIRQQAINHIQGTVIFEN